MLNEKVTLSLCIATLIAVAMVAVPVSAAGPGKLAVPGNAGIWNYGGTGADYLVDIAPTRDGGSVFIGGTESSDYDLSGLPPLGLDDIWVGKLDSGNSIEWSRRFGGSGYDWAYSIQQTTDGGYIFIADTQSTDGDVTGIHGGFDIWVVKLTGSGNIDWKYCLGSVDTEKGSFIRQTTDGGYILAGYACNDGGDVSGHHGTPGNTDAWIVKLSSTGMIVWQKCLGGSSDDEINSIIPTSDGGYLLVGYTSSDDGYITGHHGAAGTLDLWVVKLSEDGMVMWQKCLGGTRYDEGESGIQTPDGGFALIGVTYSIDGDVSGNHDSTGTNGDAWVVKLNPLGVLEWQRCLGGTEDDDGRRILPAPGGGYLLVGRASSANDDVSSPYNPSYHVYDAWVVRLNSAGSPLWQKCLGGTNHDAGVCILDTPDGGYLVGINSYSNDGEASSHNYGYIDVLLVKLYGPPSLTGIAPDKIDVSTLPQAVVMTGMNLLSGSTVRLSRDGSPDTFLTGVVVSTDHMTLYGEIGARALIPGTYTVRATIPDGQWAELPGALTITCGPAPKITSLSPTTGRRGETVEILTVRGTNFATAAAGGRKTTGTGGGMDVRFNRTGQADIVAINPVSVSATQLTCKVVIPAGAAEGKWNLVLRNPDGQYAVKTNAFTVTAAIVRPPHVSSVTPRSVRTGQPVFISGILGSAFNESASVSLTGPRGVKIPVSNVTVLSSTKISCDADLTGIPKGYATVTVTNPNGKKGTRARALALK